MSSLIPTLYKKKAFQLMQSIGQNTYLKSIMSGMMLILPSNDHEFCGDFG